MSVNKTLWKEIISKEVNSLYIDTHTERLNFTTFLTKFTTCLTETTKFHYCSLTSCVRVLLRHAVYKSLSENN